MTICLTCGSKSEKIKSKLLQLEPYDKGHILSSQDMGMDFVDFIYFLMEKSERCRLEEY